MQYPSRNQMKKAFRNGHGVYEDGQSSFSVNCQEARRCGRLPMTQAVKLARALLRKTAGKITIARIRQALKETHDGVWHHTSKFGNRTPYYDVQAAVRFLIKANEKREAEAQDSPTPGREGGCGAPAAGG